MSQDNKIPLLEAIKKTIFDAEDEKNVAFFRYALKGFSLVSENAWLFMKLALPWILISLFADFIFQNPHACQYKEIRGIFPCTNQQSVATFLMVFNLIFASGFMLTWARIFYKGDVSYLSLKISKTTIKLSFYLFIFCLIFIAPVIAIVAMFKITIPVSIFFTIPIYLIVGIFLILPFFAIRSVLIIPAIILENINFDMKKSFRLTKGNFFRISAGFFIILLVYSLLISANSKTIINFIIDYRINAIIAVSMFFKIISYAILAVVSSYLLEIYNFLVQKKGEHNE